MRIKRFKEDIMGRRTLSVDAKKSLIKKFKNSGLSQQAFCREEGLHWTTFNGWLKTELGKGLVGAKNGAVKLQEVFLSGNVYSESIVIKFPSGMELNLPMKLASDAEYLLKLERGLRC